MNDNVKNIAVLGSTGSIGTQTLDIVAEYPQRFRVSLLTAGRRWELLAEQACRFLPRRVVIADESAFDRLREALTGLPIEVLAGEAAIAEAVRADDIDMVVTAMVGYSGLLPTINAIKEGKTIALANKETLVVAGELVMGLARRHGAAIIPVDSEHSAIFQCLQGENADSADKIILTASGGPFRTWSRERMAVATADDALRHPNWSMGAKVTVDSASMMNKGFEMIEARWLFGCPPSKIEVVVHPQSIVHSMVQYADGSVKAQLGVPDMHLPIRYALGYPERLATSQKPLRLEQYSCLTFERPDMEKFRLLGLAFDAIATGGTMPCALNAANEVAVAAFLRGDILFGRLPDIAEATMRAASFVASPTYDDYVAVNAESRALAQEALDGMI